uniref:Uncharacterized protein n=1 Tax=Anguilla anguilla TaxID=7936 RepID=A0A0E9WXN3_ANGAN
MPRSSWTSVFTSLSLSLSLSHTHTQSHLHYSTQNTQTHTQTITNAIVNIHTHARTHTHSVQYTDTEYPNSVCGETPPPQSPVLTHPSPKNRHGKQAWPASSETTMFSSPLLLQTLPPCGPSQQLLRGHKIQEL